MKEYKRAVELWQKQVYSVKKMRVEEEGFGAVCRGLTVARDRNGKGGLGGV